MFSPADTIASNLWHSLVRYGNRSAPAEPQCARPTVVRPDSPAQDSLFGDNNNNNDASELPYLCVDLEESEADSPTSSEGDTSVDRFDRRLLSSLLFDDSDSDDDSTIASSIESLRSQDIDVCPTPRLSHSSSRPILKLETASYIVDVELSSPSPVDSGYGSRPDTPFVEKDSVSKRVEAPSSTSSPFDECSPIVFSQNPAVADSPEEALASPGNHILGAKTVANVTQGHVIPRIVLTDEANRMVDLTYDDEEFKFTEEPADSPYGGLMSIVEEEHAVPVLPTPAPALSRVSSNMKIQSIAAGAVVDRAFVSVVPSRARVTRFTPTPTHNHCRRAPTIVLGCVGEEEEEEEEAVVNGGFVEVAVGLTTLEEDEEAVVEEVEIVVGGGVVADEVIVEEDVAKCFGVEAEEVPRKAKESVEQLTVSTVQGEGAVGTKEDCEVSFLVDHAPVSTASMSFTSTTVVDTVAEVRPKPIVDEDDDCEACSLFFTVPDENYHRLVADVRQPAAAPGIVFGLLKPTGVLTSIKYLNTAYHVTLEGRGSKPLVAHCLFDCERGFWMTNGGLVGDFAPQDCPVHGGRGTCQVGGIFNQRPTISALDAPSPSPDYASFVAEVIGSLSLPCLDGITEDSDEDELVLHSAEVLHAADRKNAIPKAGANYDEFMSGFMDDVDISSSSSVDNFKAAPLGKLGGALKELRDAAMPEAVDHLKEGLEKTESVFRAALAATPFKFGSMSDRLVHFKSAEEKAILMREKSARSEFSSHLRQRSSISMKGKWSNMLSKFTR
ncbi:hypothetical protein BDV93DRAFT_125426 [Ceratobasidium sp. AG-I]|nr:hypothetical protein BDV93DRAFT_125426 [Ceratobasidium sp. AG-I]